MEEVSDNIEKIRKHMNEANNAFSKFGEKFVVANQATQWVSSLSSALNGALAPGAALNTKLAELAAIAGPTAEELAFGVFIIDDD